ncbi:hypothetical protein PsorP6_002642 [Peronosclerospora sorghi]|uniref:Uncharacterized protein n=1 Tax=Peronosclerospora sorghi TaxID=230839 RepID=A0ACC0WUK2_9STRA|nr:hypothetical protein PsorP6_002642 [Peronosclerospora sorghi]
MQHVPTKDIVIDNDDDAVSWMPSEDHTDNATDFNDDVTMDEDNHDDQDDVEIRISITRNSESRRQQQEDDNHQDQQRLQGHRRQDLIDSGVTQSYQLVFRQSIKRPVRHQHFTHIVADDVSGRGGESVVGVTDRARIEQPTTLMIDNGSQVTRYAQQCACPVRRRMGPICCYHFSYVKVQVSPLLTYCRDADDWLRYLSPSAAVFSVYEKDETIGLGHAINNYNYCIANRKITGTGELTIAFLGGQRCFETADFVNLNLFIPQSVRKSSIDSVTTSDVYEIEDIFVQRQVAKLTPNTEEALTARPQNTFASTRGQVFSDQNTLSLC